MVKEVVELILQTSVLSMSLHRLEAWEHNGRTFILYVDFCFISFLFDNFQSGWSICTAAVLINLI